jgi:hypothetical protein
VATSFVHRNDGCVNVVARFLPDRPLHQGMPIVHSEWMLHDGNTMQPMLHDGQKPKCPDCGEYLGFGRRWLIDPGQAESPATIVWDV